MFHVKHFGIFWCFFALKNDFAKISQKISQLCTLVYTISYKIVPKSNGLYTELSTPPKNHKIQRPRQLIFQHPPSMFPSAEFCHFREIHLARPFGEDGGRNDNCNHLAAVQLFLQPKGLRPLAGSRTARDEIELLA